MRRLAAKSVPISAHTFERVLTLCIRNSKLSQAVGTYSCMLRRYGIAPSRSIYSQLTDLLSVPSPSDAVTESLCYRILAGVCIAYVLPTYNTIGHVNVCQDVELVLIVIICQTILCNYYTTILVHVHEREKLS